VFTFSMHCGDQTFPTVVQQSDWDVPLPAGTGDEQYLQVTERGVSWHRGPAVLAGAGGSIGDEQYLQVRGLVRVRAHNCVRSMCPGRGRHRGRAVPAGRGW
jgi:hypothetical protein